MTIDDMVVDVSRDWVLACDVQQRFMQGLGRTRSAAKFEHSVAIVMISCFLRITAWGWSLATLPAKVWRGAHDCQCAVRTSDSGVIHGKRPGRLTQDSESSGIRFVARGPLCDGVLRCLRQIDAHAAVWVGKRPRLYC